MWIYAWLQLGLHRYGFMVLRKKDILRTATYYKDLFTYQELLRIVSNGPISLIIPSPWILQGNRGNYRTPLNEL